MPRPESAGWLELDGRVSANHPLEQLNQAFTDLQRGANARGVIRL